jgi:hypothetical protein
MWTVQSAGSVDVADGVGEVRVDEHALARCENETTRREGGGDLHFR